MTQQQQQQQSRSSLPKSYSLPAQLSSYSASSPLVLLPGTAPLPISRARTTTVTSIEFGVASISDFDLLGKGKGVGHSVTGVQFSRRLFAKDKQERYGHRTTHSLFENVLQFEDEVSVPREEKNEGVQRHRRSRTVSANATISSNNKNNSVSINVRTEPESTIDQQLKEEQTMSALSPPSSTSSRYSATSISSEQSVPASCSSMSSRSSSPLSSSSSSSSRTNRDNDRDNESPPSLSSSVSSSPSPDSRSPVSPISPRHPCDTQKIRSLRTIKEASSPPHSLLLSSCPSSSSLTPPSSSSSSHSPSPPVTPTTAPPPSTLARKPSTAPTRAPPSPIVIHRSRSITFATPSSPSSAALNISPAECHSLSPSTAGPADAAYFTPISPRTLSFRRKTSSFFLSLSSPSSVASLTSLYQSGSRSPVSTDNQQQAQQASCLKQAQAQSQKGSTYKSPDYLTAYFAETHVRPSSHPHNHKARSSSLSVIGSAGPGLLRTQQQQLFQKQGQDRSRSHSQSIIFSSFFSSPSPATTSHSTPTSPTSACLSAPFIPAATKAPSAPSCLEAPAPDTLTAAYQSSSPALVSPQYISATAPLSSSPPSLYSVSPPTRPSSALSSTSSSSSTSTSHKHRHSNRHHHFHHHHAYSTSPSPLGKYSSSPTSNSHSIDSRLHHHHTKHITAIATTTLNHTHVNSSHNSASAGIRYRSRHSTAAPSLYRPLMIPRKAKQGVLSLVTTEQPKYGPSRSTQSTVHGGDWGEPAVPAAGGQYQQHGIEPNSAGSGQDPWMMVTGSGSSYVSNNNVNSAGVSSSPGLPSSTGTPLNVREEQLNRMPALQLLERNADTDPVLDIETAHQIRLELPRKLRNATKWNLVYSSDQHGISMTTLFHRCKGKGPMVLALKDTTDAVFGAFVTEELKPNLTYYGTGECFLWNVTTLATSPQPASSPSFAPSPMPSPSPLQLSSSVTTPAGRSPSPSPLSTSSTASRTTGVSNNSNGNGGDRRHDLFLAMNDRLNTTGRSPSPHSGSPYQYQPHLVGSPSNSPNLHPTDATLTSPAKPPTSGGRKKKQKVVQFWKWTGKNDYMILSEPSFIGLGGGDGKFGLWLHSDLERGHSARCATFDNEPLAAACKHPIKHMAGGGSLVPTPTAPVRIAMEDTSRGNSRSSSPKDDREEFYCQTVEIWAMAL